MDLLLLNGTVVSDGVEMTTDVAVHGGVVRALGDLSGVSAAEVIDCSGKVILPGAVDLGLHLLDDGAFDPESSSGFALATRHAALGGVTTLITSVAVQANEDATAALRDQQEADTGKAIVDFGYHVALDGWDDQRAAQAKAAIAAGVPSFWITRTACEAPLPAPALLMAAAAALPEDALLITSPGDAAVTMLLSGRVKAQGAVGKWRDALPPAVEEAFLHALPGLLQGTRARVLLSGISSEAAVSALAPARERHPQLSAAVQLPALALHDGFEDLPRTWPPIQSKTDQQALFEALEAGLISVVTSGHKPRTPMELVSGGAQPVLGMASLAHFYPVLHSEGTAKWRLSLPAISQAACADPAKLAGVYPRKGTLQPGADADLVILDPGRVRNGAPQNGAASPFEVADPLKALTLQGVVESVFLRGVRIAEESALVESTPAGRFLARKLALKG